MKKKNIIMKLLFSVIICITMINFNLVDATGKTGGYHFCTAFPGFPECVGWRTQAVDDNHWFCKFVYLKDLCKNPPEPEKQIELRTEEYCCRYVGPEIKKENAGNPDQYIPSKQERFIDDTIESIAPLIIWSDRDHYNFRDKVIVYGKFDFTNPTIIQNIYETSFAQTGEAVEEKFTVDIKLNGRTVLRDIPVNSNGWFSAFFFHNNPYIFSTQDNLLEVEYITTKEVPLGGPKTHATYHFTTGEIAKKYEKFDLQLDKTFLPNKIQYRVDVENPERFIELMRQDLVKTRLITPNGYVIPLDSKFSIHNNSSDLDEFTKYGEGTYQIEVTYGNNSAREQFEYSVKE